MKLNKQLWTRLAACAALAVAASAARAEPYFFSLVGAQNDVHATWQLDSSPTPISSQVGSGFLVGFNIVGTLNHASTSFILTFDNPETTHGVDMHIQTNQQGLQFSRQFGGPKLYTGTEDTPTFELGSFDLIDLPSLGNQYLLTISAAEQATVPEPASIALVLASLGLAGFATSRRRGR